MYFIKKKQNLSVVKDPSLRLLIFHSIVFLFVFCNKGVKKDAFVVTHDGDTLTARMAAILDPGERDDSLKFRNILVRKSFAVNARDSVSDSLDVILAKQLSMESGVEWNGKAAGLLYDAARVLRVKLETDKNCTLTTAFAESLFYVLVPAGSVSFPAIKCQEYIEKDLNWISTFFSVIFNLDNQTATALAVFTNDQSDTRQKMQNTKEMVEGLVFDKIKTQRNLIALKEIVKSKTESEIGDPEKVLQYRDQKSILDSISKHIAALKALYNTHLKKNSALGGKIVIKFLLSASGDVVNISVVETNIDDNRFLDPFLLYIKTIRFKQVPEKVGSITFEFPFEFDKDL